MRIPRSRVARALVAAAVAGLVFVVAAPWLLHTTWVRDRLRALIVAKTAALVDGHLHIGGLDGSLWSDVTLSDVTIERGGRVVLSVGRVTARYRLEDFYRGTIALERVSVTRPAVAIEQTAGGWRVVGLASRPPGRSSRAAQLAIGRLQVVGGEVDLAPARAPVHRLTDVTFDGSIAVDAGGVRLDVVSAAARDASTGITLRHFAGGVGIGADLTVSHFDLETDASQATGSVTIHALRHPAGLDVDVSLRPLSFPEVARYASWAADLPALDRVDATAHGPPAHLAFSVAVDDGRAGRAQVRGTASLSPFNMAGDTEFDHANVAVYTGRPALASDASGRASFTLDLPRPEARALVVAFDTTLAHAEFDGYEGAGVAARGVYRDGAIAFTGRGLAYGATATDVRGTWTVATGAVQISAAFAAVDLHRLPSQTGAPPWETNLTGTGRMAWHPGSLRAAADLDASSGLGVTLAAGTTADISLVHDDFTYRAHVIAPDVDVGRLIAVVVPHASPRLAALTGHVTTDLTVSGEGPLHDWLRHTAHVTVARMTSDVADVRLSSLSGSADLAGGRLIASADSAVSGTLDRWIPLDGRSTVVAGHVTAHVDVPDVRQPDRLQDLGGRVQLALAQSTIAGVPIDGATADVSVAGGVATVSALEVRGSALTLQASGTLALDRSAPSSTLTYLVDVRDLSRLPGSVAPGLAGEASVSGALKGSLDDLHATGRLQATRLSYGPVHALSVEATIGGQLAVRGAAGLRGSVNATATFVTIGQSPVDRVTVVAAYGPSGLDVDLTAQQATRRAEVSGLVVLAAGRDEVRLKRLTVGSGTIAWALPAGQDARVTYAGDRLTVSGLELQDGAQRLSAEGTWRLRGPATPGADRTILLRATDIQLADLVPIALGRADMAGVINADVTLGGSAAAPAVSFDGHLEHGEINKVPLQAVTATVDYRDRRATVNATLDAGPESQLTATGTIALPGAGAGAGLAVHVQGALANVAVLGPATAALSSPHGSARVDVHLTGTVSAPRLSGTVALQDVGFIVAATGVAYRHIAATFRFDQRQVTIDGLSIEDDDGHRLAASGTVDVFASAPGARAVDLTATADSVHVLNNDLGEVALNAHVTITGDTRAPNVTGSIRVQRGRLEVDEILDRFTTTGYESAPVATNPAPGAPTRPSAAGVPTATPRTAPASAAAPAGAIRLTIELPDNLVARGHDLHIGQQGFGLGDINVTVGGRLTVTLVPGEAPLLSGRLDVVRGTYTFESRRFDLDRGGSIEFQGVPGPLDPALDLSAERDISGVTATVTLGGTLRRPKLTLASDPPLDQGDILSLIIFNRAINDLGSQEQASLAQSAGLMAASAIASPIATSVGRALDLDVFEVQQSDASGAGPTLTVGRQVSDRLFVGFKQEFGTGDVSLLTFEYRLSRFLRVVSSFAQGATEAQLREQAEAAGIDLFFVIKK